MTVSKFREGNGNPLQYSCLGSPMDRGAWLVGYSISGQKRVGYDLATKQQEQYHLQGAVGTGLESSPQDPHSKVLTYLAKL